MFLLPCRRNWSPSPRKQTEFELNRRKILFMFFIVLYLVQTCDDSDGCWLFSLCVGMMKLPPGNLGSEVFSLQQDSDGYFKLLYCRVYVKEKRVEVFCRFSKCSLFCRFKLPVFSDFLLVILDHSSDILPLRFANLLQNGSRTDPSARRSLPDSQLARLSSWKLNNLNWWDKPPCPTLWGWFVSKKAAELWLKSPEFV